jgi:class 3 adenylate cyclase/tetratricopeptide (TPR) repeat protein
VSGCPTCGEDNAERARFCSACGAPLAERLIGEVRKTVTVVFCDVANSTGLGEQLDPEALRRVLERYFACAREVLERHGGTVEKFIGDAVMAVFGVPAVHEDDALRAVRAAAELREAVSCLTDEPSLLGVQLVLRIGVNTGEVVAGRATSGESLVTGDAVVTAKRLEEAAPQGEVVLGPTTYALVRDAVEVKQQSPLPLKGKREPVPAYLLRAIRSGAPGVERRLDSSLVGRAYELATLKEAFAEALAARECRLVTVLGPAGIGKTRLSREFLAALPEAQQLSGRCLPYGDGITYWPLVEVVRQAAGLRGEEPAAEAHARLARLLNGIEDADRIVPGVAAVLALGGEASAEEVFWSFRRLFEELAREQPLLVVIDDLQWAEPVFLDLLEYMSARSRTVSLLLCCLARPELLDIRPLWTAPRPGATTVVLEELPKDDSRLLIANLLEGELAQEAHDRVAAAADGNPLFIEELLRMLIDEGALQQGDEGWRLVADPRRLELPPTISALLSARLDRLEPEERLVIEHAAVIGEVFSWSAVAALVPDELRPSVGAHLQALVRRELVRPAPPTPGAEDAFRFGHILVRDAAYAALPKKARAELHERVARIIDSRFESGIEADEIGGYHLEQAARARSELDPFDERARVLAAEAATRLAAAAHRALGHGDSPAAASLLERTVSLLPPDDPQRLGFLVDLGDALRLIGRLQEADSCLREAAERAASVGHEAVAQRAALDRTFLRWYTNPSEGTDSLLRAAHAAVPLFEQIGDDGSLAHTWLLVAEVYWIRLEIGRMQEALERAFAAEGGASRHVRSNMRKALARAAMYGPMPVADALVLCSELATQSQGDRALAAMLNAHMAHLEALDGRFEEARSRIAEAGPVLEELGKRMLVASTQRLHAGQIELLAGDAAAAEAYFRDGYGMLGALGEQGNLAGLAVYLAAALQRLGRDEEADVLAAEAASNGNPDDAEVQILWRLTRARIRAAAGAVAEAKRLAREAVAIADRTDATNMRADALLTLAAILGRAGADEEARLAARTALELYEAKGNRIGAREARGLLASEVSAR